MPNPTQSKRSTRQRSELVADLARLREAAQDIADNGQTLQNFRRLRAVLDEVKA